jgi:xylulose-5-phosphate/fructose-6-phosphate phosphoketolase
MDAMERVPKLERICAHAKQAMRDKLTEHNLHVRKYGEDMPEIRDWKWPY